MMAWRQILQFALANALGGHLDYELKPEGKLQHWRGFPCYFSLQASWNGDLRLIVL